MGNRYEIAEQNGMSREFADWFFDKKKAGCGNVWFMMMAAMWEGWQGRASMLQGDDGTLTNEGTKQAWTGIHDIDNAIIMLDRIDTLESCDDDRIESVKTVLRRLAGNTPVIPDGWVMLPAEPTQAMMNAWLSEVANWRGHVAGYRAMIAAAPQEVN